ncbi:MAG: sigma-70 family RNA polymerase sigma factor [Candidatus Nomurabacteria bacterium]|nr:sigma-70 family RNA polymerase sigma factor [Candidatus Nomurabacteria bacterium]
METTLSLENFCKKYYSFVYNRSLRLTKNKDKALDLTQDVFVRVCISFDTLDQSLAIFGWLAKITKNRFLDIARSDEAKKRKREHIDDIGECASKLYSPERPIYLDLDIEDFIMMLNENGNHVESCLYLDLQNYDKVAEHLDIPVGTVKSRVHRQRKLAQNKFPLYRKNFNI